MLTYSKTPWIASGILVVLLLLCGHWAVDSRVELARERAANATKDTIIRELQDKIDEHVQVTIEQTGQRNKAKANVQVTVQENIKEEQNDPSPRPELTDSQLDRLRKLTDTANGEINSTRELP